VLVQDQQPIDVARLDTIGPGSRARIVTSYGSIVQVNVDTAPDVALSNRNRWGGRLWQEWVALACSTVITIAVIAVARLEAAQQAEAATKKTQIQYIRKKTQIQYKNSQFLVPTSCCHQG
jgi:hypothetical protein